MSNEPVPVQSGKLTELIAKNPVLTITLGLMLALVATWIILDQAAKRKTSKHEGLPGFYCTLDDGATIFAATWDNVPPFMTESGKEAVVARVFVPAAKPKERFVAYLEKWSDASHKKLLEAEPSMRFNLHVIKQLPDPDPLIKRPGQKNWLTPADSEYQPILQVKAPDGTPAVEVLPPPATSAPEPVRR